MARGSQEYGPAPPTRLPSGRRETAAASRSRDMRPGQKREVLEEAPCGAALSDARRVGRAKGFLRASRSGMEVVLRVSAGRSHASGRAFRSFATGRRTSHLVRTRRPTEAHAPIGGRLSGHLSPRGARKKTISRGRLAARRPAPRRKALPSVSLDLGLGRLSCERESAAVSRSHGAGDGWVARGRTPGSRAPRTGPVATSSTRVARSHGDGPVTGPPPAPAVPRRNRSAARASPYPRGIAPVDRGP